MWLISKFSNMFDCNRDNSGDMSLRKQVLESRFCPVIRKFMIIISSSSLELL